MLSRVALIIAAVVVAFVGARLARKPSAPSPEGAAIASAPAVQTSEQILAQIPRHEVKSATGQALASAMAKVREKDAVAARWVALGDVLAQLLRDTADEKYYDHAEAAYQYALRLEPKNVDAMTGMAWVTGGRHDFDKSREWANRSLALDATNAAAYGILGDADVELGDYEVAYTHYQKMMDLKPDLSSWSRGAHLLWLTGDTKKAAWLLEKAIKAGAPFAENTAWCRAKLAMILFSQGALLPAEQALEPSLKAGSKNAHVLLAAAKIAAARGDIAASEKHCRAILEAGPNHFALVELGDLLATTDRKAEAEKSYQQAEELDRAQTARAGHSHMAMAKFYADHDRKLIEALRMAEARKLTRNVNEADTLAWVYFKNGDQPRAIEAIKRALSQKTQDAEIHFHAGMIAAKFGDRVSAQNHLQTALSINPHFSLLLAPVAVATLQELGSRQPAAAVPKTAPIVAQ